MKPIERKLCLFIVCTLTLGIILLAAISSWKSFTPRREMQNEARTSDAQNTQTLPAVQPPQTSEIPTTVKPIITTDQTPQEKPIASTNYWDPLTPFYLADVGERYQTVVQPVTDAVFTILQDMIESEEVRLPAQALNPRVTEIRYAYGSSLWITFRYDLLVDNNGEKSEFLQWETAIELENFPEVHETPTGDNYGYGQTYKAFVDFLKAEKRAEGRYRYEEIIAPYAETFAEMLLENYHAYTNRKISYLNFGTQLILKADSPLQELYARVSAQINRSLQKKGYPLLNGHEIEFSFGGNIYEQPVYSHLQISVNFQNLRYCWQFRFNENEDFSEEEINRMFGTIRTGYINQREEYPATEEYEAFFEKLKADELDYSQDSFALNPSYLDNENTFLSLGNHPV